MRSWKGLVAIILLVALCLLGGVSVAETIDVSTAAQLTDAVDRINAATSGDFVINLTADIETSASMGFSSAATKTILGNGHTIKFTNNDGAVQLLSGTLNLGDDSGNSVTLVPAFTGGCSTSCIQVTANTDNGEGGYHPVLNMYDGVVISGWKTDNSYGAAIRTHSANYYGNDVDATFNMYGGTISDCGFISGSEQHGGGVAVLHNGIFNMFGGTITGCSAKDGGGVVVIRYETESVNNPVFNMAGGTISNNTATTLGGGVSVLNGYFTMDGGSIIDNSAADGGGISNAGSAHELIINDGEITGNQASNNGGGVYSTKPVNMSNGVLCNNTAGTRASDIFAYSYVVLPSASGMDQKYQGTRFTIDGWYIDYPASGLTRWEYEEAFKGSSSQNIYYDDTVYDSGMPLIAAFTGYDEIQIEKTWEDQDNLLGKRPDSLTFSLTDAAGNPIHLRTLDGSTGAEAIVTITEADGWKGTIGPLDFGDYADETQYLLSESDPGILYILDGDKPTIAFTADTPATSANSGVYKAAFKNVGRVPVTINKIWDDANNLDGKRPSLLNVDLRMNGSRLIDFDGNEALYGLTDADGWQKKVYLPIADYTDMTASEGTIADYTLSSKAINRNDDGSFSVVMINKHTLEPATTDTVRNENMVEIHYQAAKEWDGTNPVGDKKLPRPQITVTLYADGVEYDSVVIAADTADPATATFSNVPKYKDNDGNEPIAYTIKEEITDAAWVKVGDNLWYSLDGMGKYEGTITDVTADDVGNTAPLNTLTGGKATNTYTTLQTTTTVDVTKLWKDHQNENGVRPAYLKLGLFKNGSDTDPVATVTINGPLNNDEWNGTFINLPIYDADGSVIDYSTYIIKEAYPATLNSDGTPASWADWISDEETYTITKDGNDYDYDYSIVSNP